MVMNRIALYNLETLLWINRLGSFSAAANRLNTTQPGISARIRELENHLGIPLFARQGRNMILSVQGRELVRRCEQVWPSLQQALLNPVDLSSVAGIVRIGSGEIAAASCLSAFVNAIRQEMPGLSLEIEIDLTSKLIDGLLSGAADLVFAIGPVEMPGIKTRRIGEVELIWLASPSLANMLEQRLVPPKDLLFWSLARSSPMHAIMHDALGGLGYHDGKINTCNDLHSLIDIIVSSGGVSLFPLNMVGEKISSGEIVRVFDQSPPPILLQAAIRSAEKDPIILHIFEIAHALKTEEVSAPAAR